MQFGIGVMIIGFTVVFITLFALYFIMLLFNYIFSPKKEEKKAENDKVIKVNTEESVVKNQLDNPSQEEILTPELQLSANDDPSVVTLDVVAAITATLSVVLGKEQNEFLIKDIQLSQGPKNGWNVYGRIRQVDSRANFNFFRRERK